MVFRGGDVNGMGVQEEERPRHHAGLVPREPRLGLWPPHNSPSSARRGVVAAAGGLGRREGSRAISVLPQLLRGHQRVGSAGMSPRTASPSVSGHGPQPRLQTLPRAHSSVFGDRQQQPPLRTRTSPGQGEAACGQGAQVRAGAPSAGRQGTASRLSPRCGS